jgi:hypothetical protein
MPILKRKPKTFKEKREALGVERKGGATKVYNALSGKIHLVGGIDKGQMKVTGHLNPKIKSIYEKTTAQVSLFNKQIEKLNMQVPKDRADALKIKKKIEALNSEKSKLIKESNLKVEVIKHSRISVRKNKQAEALFRTLYGLAFPKSFNNAINRSKLNLNPNRVRESYIEYVTKNFSAKNFSFTQLTTKDANIILGNAIQKTNLARKK